MPQALAPFMAPGERGGKRHKLRRLVWLPCVLAFAAACGTGPTDPAEQVAATSQAIVPTVPFTFQGNFQIGTALDFANGHGHFCWYQDPSIYWGMTGSAPGYTAVSYLPAGWVYDGACQFVGLFMIGGTVFNEVNTQVCAFPTWASYVTLTGRNSVSGVPSVDALPYGAAYVGACGATWPDSYASFVNGMGAGAWANTKP
jgi:hypothetical protein